MGITEREIEGSSGVSLNEHVSQLLPGDKCTIMEEPIKKVTEIEMELFPKADKKQNKKYHKISQVEEMTDEEISLDDELVGDEEQHKLTQEESGVEQVKNTQMGLFEKVKKFQQRNALKIAWACTICGALCTGWIGPCFRLLGSKGVAAGRRASWRSQVLFLLLLIPTVLEYRALTPQQKRDLFNKRTLLQLLLCGTLWFFDLFLWSNALDFTTVSRSSVFASTASLMILVWSLVRRQPLSVLEVLGGVIGFSGLVFAVVGTNLFFASDAEKASKDPLKGDILSIGTAACVAAYVLNATKVRAKVSLFIYTISNTLILIIFLSTASFIMEGTKIDATVNGIFGWANPKFVVIVALLSVVAGMIGFNLNNAALRYMPPLGYTLVALCDPFVSGTYAWIIGADGVPGVFTFMGGIITISGIVVLVIGQEKRKQKERRISEEKAKQTHEEEEEKEDAPKVTDFVVSDGTEV